VAVIRASYTKAGAGGASSAKEGLRYGMHRADAGGDQQYREVYDRNGTLSKQEAYDRIDQAEQGGGRYYYRLTLNQGQGHGQVDMQAWTRDVMGELEQRHGRPVEWLAVEHKDHSQHDHVHVIAVTSKTLSKADLAALRTEADQSWERHAEQVRDWHGAEQVQGQNRGQERYGYGPER